MSNILSFSKPNEPAMSDDQSEDNYPDMIEGIYSNVRALKTAAAQYERLTIHRLDEAAEKDPAIKAARLALQQYQIKIMGGVEALTEPLCPYESEAMDLIGNLSHADIHVSDATTLAETYCEHLISFLREIEHIDDEEVEFLTVKNEGSK